MTKHRSQALTPALMKVKFDSLPSAVGGTYSLSWGTTDFTVWTDDKKHTKLSSGTTFSASPTGTISPVYVEGVSKTNTMGADQLTLRASKNTP